MGGRSTSTKWLAKKLIRLGDGSFQKNSNALLRINIFQNQSMIRGRNSLKRSRVRDRNGNPALRG
jgi:hypothetical protein